MDDDTIEIEVDAEENEEEGEFTYDDLDPNLAWAFSEHSRGKEALRRISEKVRSDFDSAHDSTEDFRERCGKDWRLVTGDLPKKKAPFKNMANVHVPISLENLSRLAYRTIGEVFGDWQYVFGVMPVGGDDEGARILSAHGNWQIREQIPDFRRQQYRAVMAFYAMGDVTTVSRRRRPWWTAWTWADCAKVSNEAAL